MSAEASALNGHLVPLDDIENSQGVWGSDRKEPGLA